MSTSNTAPGARISSRTGRHVAPNTPVGWWALGVSFVGLAAWVVLPIITMTFRDVYPVTDTALMPIIGVVLIDSAAIFDLLSVFRWNERSALNVALTIITVVAALFFTFIVVAEGIAGV